VKYFTDESLAESAKSGVGKSREGPYKGGKSDPQRLKG